MVKYLLGDGKSDSSSSGPVRHDGFTVVEVVQKGVSPGESWKSQQLWVVAEGKNLLFSTPQFPPPLSLWNNCNFTSFWKTTGVQVRSPQAFSHPNICRSPLSPRPIIFSRGWLICFWFWFLPGFQLNIHSGIQWCYELQWLTHIVASPDTQ